MGRFLEAADRFMSPSLWPVRYRRMFICTVPVTGPIYLATAMVLFLGIVVFGLAWIVLGGLIELVRGMIDSVRKMWRDDGAPS